MTRTDQRRAGAFLALWNSVSGAYAQAEYEAWHTFEHVPERVGLPGFIEARRYRALADPLRYFTFYGLDSPDALDTPEYRDVFTHPTPWSARMRLRMRDFFRMPCASGGDYGHTSAVRIAALHLQSGSDDAAARIDASLRMAVDAARLVRAHWGTALPAQDYPLGNVRSGATAEHQFILLLHHQDARLLQAATDDLLRQLAPMAQPVRPPDFCELLTHVRQDELGFALTARQPPRNDWMARFCQLDRP